jgi:hypothetical protein
MDGPVGNQRKPLGCSHINTYTSDNDNQRYLQYNLIVLSYAKDNLIVLSYAKDNLIVLSYVESGVMVTKFIA